MASSQPTHDGRNGRGGKFKPLVPLKGPGVNRVAYILQGQGEGLARTLGQALENGLGVLLSPTRDRGALSIIVYEDNDAYQSYAASPEELGVALDAIHARAKQLMGGGSGEWLKPPQKAPERT